LFRDEQRKILDIILEATEADAQSVYRHLFEHHIPLMRFLRDSHSPPPRALATAGELVVNSRLRREFARDQLDFEAIQSFLEEADLAGIPLDADTLEFTLRTNLERMALNFLSSPEQHDLLAQMVSGIELVYALPFDVNLRKVQDLHYTLAQRIYPKFKQNAQQGDSRTDRWVKDFEKLSEKLMIRIE
jgi:hypothetical protein